MTDNTTTNDDEVLRMIRDIERTNAETHDLLARVKVLNAKVRRDIILCVALFLASVAIYVLTLWEALS